MSPIIQVNGVQVHFRGCEALRGVDLRVPPQSVFALLGENGAGKTTLIRVLTGFLTPTAGSCTVLGLDPTTQAVELRRRIGYVSDAPALYDWMRVAEIGWFAASFYLQGYWNRYRDFIHQYEVPEDRKIRHLSKGQRAKVALALALAHDPELLILDEPTSGLDPLVRREFLESMLDRVATGRTVLLSSHQIHEVERVADQVAVIREGRVCLTDTLADLKNTVASVTVNCSDPLVTLPELEPPAEVLREETEGRQRRIVVRHFTASHQQQFEAVPAVSSVHVANASLEDVYAAVMRGSRQAKSSRDRLPTVPVEAYPA